MSDNLSKISQFNNPLVSSNQATTSVTTISKETENNDKSELKSSTSIQNNANTPVSTALFSAISQTSELLQSGSTIRPGQHTDPISPAVSDDPSTTTKLPIHPGQHTDPIFAPEDTTPHINIKPQSNIKNVYGTKIDIDNAKNILGTTGYNYICTDSNFINPGSFYSSDIILGDSDVTGITNSELHGAVRLAGANRNLTAQALENYNVHKCVYGTKEDLDNAKDILGNIGYDYIQTDSSDFKMPQTFTSNDIILGGIYKSGGIGNIDLNGAVRIEGNDVDETARMINNYSVSKNVYVAMADLETTQNILGTVGYNYIMADKSGFKMPQVFSSNDIIIGNVLGDINNEKLNGAVKLTGANSDLTFQAIRNYLAPKNVYGIANDLTNAKNILGGNGYNYIQIDTSNFKMPSGFTTNDIILGSASATGIADDKLNGAIRLAGENESEMTNLINNYSTSKNVYGSAIDIKNAKNILGSTGYNYIETDLPGFIRPTAFTSNDIILGNPVAEGGIDTVFLNGGIRLAGLNSDLTAQAINNFKYHKNIYGAKEDIVNAKSILGDTGYNYIETDAPNFKMPAQFTTNDIILGNSTETGISDDMLNCAIRLSGANKDETANLVYYYSTAKNIYGSLDDIRFAERRLGTIGFNYIRTDVSGYRMPIFTSNDIILDNLQTRDPFKSKLVESIGKTENTIIAETTDKINLNGATKISYTDNATMEKTLIANPNITRVLQQGCTGNDVKELQNDLITLGYSCGSSGADGSFGPDTKAAVISFQGDCHLVKDGSFGPATNAALKQAIKTYNDYVKEYGSSSGSSPSTSGSTPVEITSDLSYGSQGDQVKELQRELIALGYDCGGIDGSFGPATRNAVLNFQSDNHITVDGSVGPETRRTLKQALKIVNENAKEAGSISGSSSGTTSPTVEITSDLSNGSTGAQVKQLQQDLIALGYDCGPCKDDGSFGPATEAAVKNFQRDKGLEQDGSVGPATRQALKQAMQALQKYVDNANQNNAITNTTTNNDIVVDSKIVANIMKGCGFTYDAGQDTYVSTLNNAQRHGGYCEAYDIAAASAGCVIDAEPMKFETEDGKQYMIELWKGQYGATTGAEIGIYVQSKDKENYWYPCASNDDLIDASFVVTGKDNDQTLVRSSKEDIPDTTNDKDHKLWWLTAFKPGVFSTPADLTMYADINLKNQELSNKFKRALDNAGYTKENSRLSQNGTEVSFVYTIPRNFPRGNKDPEFVISTALGEDRFFKDKYNEIKKETGVANNSPDSISKMISYLINQAKNNDNMTKDQITEFVVKKIKEFMPNFEKMKSILGLI